MNKYIILIIFSAFFFNKFAIKMYSVKTPDGTYIEFHYLSVNEGKALLKDGHYELLPQDKLDFYKRNAYLFSDRKILYQIQPDLYYFLFDDESDYRKMLRGEKYFKASIIFDKTSKELYSSFNLDPIYGYEFFQKKVKQLEKYPVFDGYHTYLMPDSTITYLRHRVNKLYDGYWYPSLKVFEHEYYLLTSNKYFPSKPSFL